MGSCPLSFAIDDQIQSCANDLLLASLVIARGRQVVNNDDIANTLGKTGRIRWFFGDG
jgi:hypothetical protein